MSSRHTEDAMFPVSFMCSNSADATASASAQEVRPVAIMFTVLPLPLLVVHSSGHCANRAALHSYIQLVLLDCQ